MKLIRQNGTVATPNQAPIFAGEVRRQNLVADGDASLVRPTAVTFEDGARNKLHRHTTDQVLATHGHGIVATLDEELHVSPGDVVLIPAGERHWHGAATRHDFTHLSILTPGEMVVEE
ncbi:MAG: hypothetical protein AVDCRST_MAG19-2168 [uncultured Thermomicrobiales bacterium]|uniref:Cupin type-2 domain-containing protein n=1 Tax=uncultured Thermomicrobiales bacterium TaxID=1645740 RepID=A0A6J4UZJ5_9BACT|nr:MAG: hypothetical protein AVDCRST_MAG19-2168 [uncultured Thermomicrobiales bacterium]